MRRVMLAGLFLGAALAAGTVSAASSDTVQPSQLLNNKPALKAEYTKLIKPIESNHHWVTSMGTETPVSRIKIDGAHYAVLSGCKPHDCGSESIVSLMTPSSEHAVGALVINHGQQAMGPKSSKIVWLGRPDRSQRRFIAAYLFR